MQHTARHHLKVILVGCALGLGVSTPLAAEEGNWKVGRIYYRMVCTKCHVADGGESISPAARTKKEWRAFFEADTHAGGGKAEATVSHYTSQAYRESIKDSNRAAKKLLSVPDDQMFANVLAFAVHGAKDSDTPARCQ